MVSEKVVIRNRTGLHARPASDLVAYVKKFPNKIYLKKGMKKIDASSIIHMLTLGAAEGTEIEVSVEGEDEEKVLESVIAFIKELKG